jgi:hypothetical protein
LYGYDAGDGVCQDAEFVLMLGRLRNEGFRTPRIGAVSNTPNGVLTILSFPFFLFFLPLLTERTEKRSLDGVEEGLMRGSGVSGGLIDGWVNGGEVRIFNPIFFCEYSIRISDFGGN